jgi:hypothetical protein
LLSNDQWLQQIESVAHSKTLEFVAENNLNERCIGWIDVHLLASAKNGKVSLWTAELRLEAIAKEMGLAYIA